MTDQNPPNSEVEALRQRLSALSAAILRISGSLDMTTVLQEAANSARALTGARYGMIVTVNEAGEPDDFVTSGLTEDEVRRLVELPSGLQLFNHLRDLPGPLRLDDLPGYIHALGLGPDLSVSNTLQAAPIQRGDAHVGQFFLGDKKGGPGFTDEDEELLVLFATQVAAAIGNVRTHRAEHQTRVDLEVLIETTPVGVVVFDARTGRPVTFNREARRIVDKLITPGGSVEGLLEVISYRRADGREFSLAEFPLAEQFRAPDMVRAEEMVLSVPDGRSMETLDNATPIHAEDGTAASVVVTLQDLAPIQELERMRAEFLGMVSHELRAPLTSIKGSAATALATSRGGWSTWPRCASSSESLKSKPTT